MATPHPRARRRGFTLVELLIALVLVAIVGIAFTRLLRSQLRFADQQSAARNAREVSRGAINALATDVRMVDADSGIVTATADSFTVLAPYAEGVVCGSGGGGSVIALLPYDSVAYAEGGYAGFAYIDTTTTGTDFDQVYQYRLGGPTPTVTDSATTATSAPCQTASDRIGVFHPGSVTVAPTIPDQSRYQAAILVRYVTYAFRPSLSIPGARGLFRTVVNGTHGTEEIMAPFDTSAHFSYYLVNGTRVPSATAATLHDIRGIHLQLDGLSEGTAPGSTGPQRAPLATAVFFKNRPLD